jgi:hypothetical protein
LKDKHRNTIHRVNQVKPRKPSNLARMPSPLRLLEAAYIARYGANVPRV